MVTLPFTQSTRHRRRLQRGMTLIESLVALVILAFGVLGLIGFQMQTLRDTRESVGRSRALVAIQDISERMRLNQTSLPLYATGFAAAAAPAVDCIANVCNSGQLVPFDIWRWKTNLSQALPAGLGAIAPSPTDPRQILVMVAWRENQVDAATADATRTDPIKNPADTLVGSVNGLTCPVTFTCHRVYVQPFK
jgi:type IV pilus assembly protein PilV